MTSQIQISVIGDYQAGKSSLINAMIGRPAPIIAENYYPMNHETYKLQSTVNGNSVDVSIVDVAPHQGGRGDWGQERHIEYSKSQCVVICMNLAPNKDLADSSATNWREDVAFGFKSFFPSSPLMVPIVVAGTMSDLRNDTLVKDDPNRCILTLEKAQEIAKTIGGEYIETSSVTKEGCKNVLQTAINLAAEYKVKNAEFLANYANGVVGTVVGGGGKAKKKDCVIL